MEKKSKAFRYIFATGLLALPFLLVSHVQAALPVITPGKTLAFTQADGGKRECLYGRLVIPDWLGCGNYFTVWHAKIPDPSSLTAINTSHDAAGNYVGAAFSNISLEPPQLGVPYNATGAVWNDFSISDPDKNGDIVDAQFSVAYMVEGGIAGTANYDGALSVSLEVEDITRGTGSPVSIGSLELFNKDRQGDQGFTDIAAGGSTYRRANDSGSFWLKLHRGHSYRIWFKAEAAVAPFIATLTEASVQSSWSSLSVTVNEVSDIANLLNIHEDNIKQSIEDHEINIMNYIDAHEARMKDELSKIHQEIAEIKRLLLTPQGRRNGFPLK